MLLDFWGPHDEEYKEEVGNEGICIDIVGQKPMSVGSFYKKKTLTKGIDKANQVLKWQKALAAIEEATKKQAANKIGRHSLHSSSDSLSSLFRNWLLLAVHYLFYGRGGPTSYIYFVLFVTFGKSNKLLYFLH